MIRVETNDSVICDVLHVAQQIISRMHSHNLVALNTNGEGPCAESLGLYALLDSLCKHNNYDHSRVHIHTCNMLETHSIYKIQRRPQLMYLQAAKTFAQPEYKKTFAGDFKHFGNFIGHGNQHRLHLASYLYAQHRSQTLQTYHCDPTADYHRRHIGLEDLMHAGQDTVTLAQAFELIQASPLTVDQIDQYPILNPTTLNITKIYPDFFVELVNVTYFTGNTFYVDEKIWRPMLMRTPFIVQGPQNFLNNLKRLGFQTFDRWWPEGYSEDPATSQVTSMIPVIKTLSESSISDLAAMYQDMLPILEHNYQRMFEITELDFMRAFDVRS